MRSVVLPEPRISLPESIPERWTRGARPSMLCGGWAWIHPAEVVNLLEEI
jgi:hypothetical protein